MKRATCLIFVFFIFSWSSVAFGIGGDGITGGTDSAATQSPNDNSARIATTSYVDSRYREASFSIPETGLADNTIFKGPLFRAVVLDNIIVVVQDNTGKLSGTSADNTTFNVQCCSTSACSSPTSVFTSNQTATGASDFSAAINNASCPIGGVLRSVFSVVNMTNKKFYIQIRWRE